MTSRELKVDILQTMFRIKNMQGLFHTKNRWHGHGHSHGHLDFADASACADQHGLGDDHGFTVSAMVILSMIAARTDSATTAAMVATATSPASGDTAPVDATSAASAVSATSATTPSSEASFAAELQRRLHVSKAAVSQNLMALEKKGLITRTLNPRDMRRFDFALTDKGKRITDHMQHHMDENLEIVLERMGEQDTRELIRLSNKFIDIVEDMGARSKAHAAENQERADA
jgi:DNA-binding MarR family transcriptional regulator